MTPDQMEDERITRIVLRVLEQYRQGEEVRFTRVVAGVLDGHLAWADKHLIPVHAAGIAALRDEFKAWRAEDLAELRRQPVPKLLRRILTSFARDLQWQTALIAIALSVATGCAVAVALH